VSAKRTTASAKNLTVERINELENKIQLLSNNTGNAENVGMEGTQGQ
jgi:hypothetical protein